MYCRNIENGYERSVSFQLYFGGQFYLWMK